MAHRLTKYSIDHMISAFQSRRKVVNKWNIKIPQLGRQALPRKENQHCDFISTGKDVMEVCGFWR
jgi:hypothetical protein